MEKGVPIRAVSRGLAVLQSINRHGSQTLMEIADAVNLPYPTACRLVQTLVYEGMIEREPARKRYRPTALVHTLSMGYQEDNRLVTAAREPIVALTKRVVWPVSIATRVGNKMMIRDSTHALTSLTFNKYYPGFTLPLLECSSGRAYLGGCDPDELEAVKSGLSLYDDAAGERAIRLAREVDWIVEDVRAKGYATLGRNKHTANPGKTSSISAPIRHDGSAVGVLTLVFFSAAMSMDEAVEKYAEDVMRTANEIGAAFAADVAPATRVMA